MEDHEQERRHDRDRNDQHDQHDQEAPIIIVNVEDDDDNQTDQKAWLQQLVVSQADRIINYIQEAIDTIMLNLDTLNAAVANQTTVDSAIITLTTGIAGQLQAMIDAGNVDQAALQVVVDQITANSAAIADAVVKNTPAAPPVDGGVPDVPPTEPAAQS
jgi:hypothetical protein